MNGTPPEGKVVSVLMVGMDERKLAVFRMAFKMHAIHRYQLVDDAPEAHPDIAIVDMDQYDAPALWKQFRATYPNLPAMVATANSTADAPAPVLPKPVRVETLFPLLRQVLAGEAPAPQAAGPAALPKETRPQTAAPHPAREPARPIQLHQLPQTIETFSPHQGLLGVLRKVRRDATPSVVTIGGRTAIIVLPNQDRALLQIDMEAIRESCQDADASVSARPLGNGDRPSRAESMSFVALLWQVAIWTARGRVPEGVDPHTPVRLRHWPNLTRLAPIPDGMRIAAFLVRSPCNLRLTIKMLNIPARHIFDFLAGAYCIGILEIQETVKQEKLAAQTAAPAVVGERPGEGGLLSRLLRKVVGL